jgi:hypothetical protein
MINMMDRIAIMNEARAQYRVERYKKIRQQAEEFFEEHKNEPLFISGVMLYWAEGKTTEKSTCNLELNNSDPSLLKLYCKFLKKYLCHDIKRWRARLFLYPDINENKIRKFWSSLLRIPEKQFIKSYISQSRSNITKNKLVYGTCSVYIPSKELRIIISVWTDLFIKSFGIKRCEGSSVGRAQPCQG